jgi:ATP-dependent 26S proteasome regulatory subunit
VIEQVKVRQEPGSIFEINPLIFISQKIIIEPLHNPAIFTRLGLKVPSGILLYGPPGTGKSMLVQAIATASGINFISIQVRLITICKWR